VRVPRRPPRRATKRSSATLHTVVDINRFVTDVLASFGGFRSSVFQLKESLVGYSLELIVSRMSQWVIGVIRLGIVAADETPSRER